MGADELGLPPFDLDPPSGLREEEKINLDWQSIKLSQLFEKMNEAKQLGLHVCIQDTTDQVCTFYQYNPHTKLLDFNKEILKHRAKTSSKEDVQEVLRKGAIYSMRHGTTFSINLDVLLGDFQSTYKDPDQWPSHKIFDLENWRKNKNYEVIVREEDKVDLFGNTSY
jgi:hypothetical protein